MQWQQLTAQRLTPFALDIIMRSFITGTERSFGKPYLYYKKIGARGYIAKEFHAEYIAYLKKRPLSFFRKTFTTFHQECEETVQWFGLLAQQDWKALDEAHARMVLKDIDTHLLRIGGTLIAPVILDTIFADLLDVLASRLPPEQQEFYKQALSVTSKTTSTGLMEKELLELCLTKPSHQNIEVFAIKWAWFGMKFFAGTPFSPEDIQARVMPPGVAKEKLKAMEHAEIDRNANYEKALKLLQLSDAEKEIIALFQENIHFRTYRLDITAKIGYDLLPFFRSLAQLRGITLEDIYCHTPNELLQGRLPKQELLARKEDFSMVMEDGHITIITGRSQELLVEKGDHATVHEVQGMCANKGFAKGSVCIIFEKKDLGKVKEGDILVAEMTYPDYNLAMAKAAAIVTDIGGVTCHAAIIARELGKPCIIGTKNATKVFKDGDVVEVDAIRGIVRKLP